MHKLLTIVGPTATGKTGLGTRLAKKYNGEIVSADSRQVYIGMDIGTGKDQPDDVKVWLYDVIEPNQRFSAVEYAKLAWEVIEDIWQRGKLPILVGGTGFYIKAVLEGIGTSGVVADWGLRKELKSLRTEELKSKLIKLDVARWDKMNESDRMNPRRLVRAIEIGESQNHKITGSQDHKKVFQVLQIGLKATKEVLYGRIDERVEKRVENGILDEVEVLLEKGYKWSDPGMNALGYKEWKDFFNKKASQEECIQKWKYDEHKYARRQLTWFKKVSDIRWFDVDKSEYASDVEDMVRKWYDN
jgi:tRNA dimethylallyltransferase